MKTSNTSASVQAGIGWFTALGISLAVQFSYGLNHDMGWAIWHGCLGWIYVIYR